MEKRFIYADHSATTAVSYEVLQAMLPYFKENYGNPSSIYSKGRENERAIIDARSRIAKCLGADPKEIFFTSMTAIGTSENNLKPALHLSSIHKAHPAALLPSGYRPARESPAL